jgi:hypothetical protein
MSPVRDWYAQGIPHSRLAGLFAVIAIALAITANWGLQFYRQAKVDRGFISVDDIECHALPPPSLCALVFPASIVILPLQRSILGAEYFS